MRDYGKVFCAIWASDDFRSLTEDGRSLVLYLLTCQHCTAIGAFRLPDLYAVEDLQWDVERVLEGFEELFQKGFATRDERSKWVVIRKFLTWNPIENPNQAIAAAKLATLVPEGDAKVCLIKGIRAAGRFLDKFNLEPLPNPSETLSKPGAVTGAVTGTGEEPPIVPLGEPSLPNKPSKRKGKTTFGEWEAAQADDADLIPPDHFAFKWAKDAGIPDDFVALAWEAFRERYTTGDAAKKTYGDWLAVFAKAITENWLKLWFCHPDGRYELSTVGRTAMTRWKIAA